MVMHLANWRFKINLKNEFRQTLEVTVDIPGILQAGRAPVLLLPLLEKEVDFGDSL